MSASGELRRLRTLFILWLGAAVTYYVLLVRPYGLTTHLATPRLSLGVIANRRPAAAADFLLCFFIAFVVYALGYRLSRNWRSWRVAAACLAMGLLTTALLALVYPIGATDVFDYIVEGEELALRGLNPLAVPAAAAPNLPLIRYATYARAISPYGPLWISLQAAVAKITSPGGVLAATIGFKALAVLGYLLAAAMILAVLRRRAPQQMVAGLIAFAWNPLVLYEVAVNAHNDVWIGALVLVAVLFWELRRPLLMLGSLTLALLIKAFAAPLLPLFAIAAWRRDPSGRRLGAALLGVGVVAVLFALPYVLLPQGTRAMSALSQRTDLYTHSLPAVVYLVLAARVPQHTAALLAGGATTGVFGIYVLLQLRNAWRQPEEVLRLAFNVLLFLLLVCMPWFQPWYLVSVMALAAVYPRRDAPFQAALSTACVVVSYVVYGFAWFWSPLLRSSFLEVTLLAVLTTYAVPWAYAIWSGLMGVRQADGRERQAFEQG